ncbi:TPA: hypothetical protein EYO12_03035 [Candidatus Saccharibacteria bacterium]|nr:hypothetical protein [Candidatus Saccharibacteria bacterium]HIO87991.1 hypothetical protein [Candidatus Saccharibacteria bacterium]
MQPRSWSEFEQNDDLLYLMSESTADDWVNALLAEGYAKEQFEEDTQPMARKARIGALFDDFAHLLSDDVGVASEAALWASDSLDFESARVVHIIEKFNSPVPNPDTLRHEEFHLDVVIWSDSDEEIFITLFQQTKEKGSQKISRFDGWTACLERYTINEGTVDLEEEFDVDFVEIPTAKDIFKGDLKSGKYSLFPIWEEGIGLQFVGDQTQEALSSDRRYPIESIDENMFNKLINLLDQCLAVAESYYEKPDEDLEQQAVMGGLTSLIERSKN